MSTRDQKKPDQPPLVLVVEPAAVLRTVVKDICERRGAEVLAASDVGNALIAIARQRPAAVLSAVELPGLPGTALVAALRSCCEYRAIPIAILTSADAARAVVGVYQPDRIIVKDARFQQQIDEFLTSLSIGEADGAARQQDRTDKRRLSARILLAEDSASIQTLLSRVLHMAGAEVTVASDGRQAVELARQRPFDLILMDIEMPELDGREATKVLRADGFSIPIIALTAHDADEFGPQARQIGFDGVIGKPTKRETLIGACQEQLEHRHATEKETPALLAWNLTPCEQ
jgi:CheY-like chemotaxis protein